MTNSYGGQLLVFTLVEDDGFPFCYAYGIRQSDKYGVHFVRTAPVNRIDYGAKLIYTIVNHYRFVLQVDDVGYRALLCKKFSHIIMPIWDDELILSPAGLILN